MKPVAILCFMFFNLTGCTESFPSRGEMEREKFIQTYVALLETKTNRVTAGTDSTTFVNPDSIFERYQVTREQFEQTIGKYNEDLLGWRDFYNDVLKELNMKNKKGEESVRAL